MFKIKESKNKQGIFFSSLSTNFKNLIDPKKEDILLNDISLGLNNRIAYQKFQDYMWPLWLYEVSDFYSPEYRPSPNPLLLNTNFRDWQSFTNYLSDEEIHIDRSGMISGPGNSPWSIEFWFMKDGIIYYPQKYYRKITPVRDYKSGEIVISGRFGDTDFCMMIAGANTGINEALINYEIKTGTQDSAILLVVRPYNYSSIGGVDQISFNENDLRLRINGLECIALDRKPDFLESGTGSTGDIKNLSGYSSDSVSCSDGMATLALGYSLKKGKNILNLRLSLETKKSIPAVKVDYSVGFREFQTFSEMRINEGLKIEVPDESLVKYFNQAKITLLNNNVNDIDFESIEGYKNLYFFSYAMNRVGLDIDAEKLFSIMLDKLKYNVKNPDYVSAISASYLLDSFLECYLHKRDSEFLQSYYPSIRKLADYVYQFSCGIHSLRDLPGNTKKNNYIKEATEYDFVILLSVMINASYLSRCMGIFGDEVRYKNEGDRLQSIVKNLIVKKRNESLENVCSFFPLFSFPESYITGYKDDDYTDFLSSMTEEKNFPIYDNSTGINLFSSALILIHLLSLKDWRFRLYYKKFFSFIDDFFTLPEFMDPVLKRGVWGEGNLKITAALILVIIRNRLFLDRPDRLEIFPIPEKEWFEQGKRVKVDNALTRFGRISFLSESSGDEIKITFPVLPKFIPSDILINIPVESTIVESDEFILKRKVGDSYIINGWPSILRFNIIKKINKQVDNNIKDIGTEA